MLKRQSSFRQFNVRINEVEEMPKIYYSIGMIILLFVELIIGYFFIKSTLV